MKIILIFVITSIAWLIMAPFGFSFNGLQPDNGAQPGLARPEAPFALKAIARPIAAEQAPAPPPPGAAAQAQSTPIATPNKRVTRNPSGLPIPRFAVLEAKKTWGRIGPSFDYPVRYEFYRQSLPVKIIGETRDNEWRQIEDHEGAQMWIHRAKLTSRNMAMINVPDGVALQVHPLDSGQARAHLEYGVLARYRNCDRSWCEVTIGKYRGYVRQDALWGVNPGQL